MGMYFYYRAVLCFECPGFVCVLLGVQSGNCNIMNCLADAAAPGSLTDPSSRGGRVLSVPQRKGTLPNAHIIYLYLWPHSKMRFTPFLSGKCSGLAISFSLSFNPNPKPKPYAFPLSMPNCCSAPPPPWCCPRIIYLYLWPHSKMRFTPFLSGKLNPVEPKTELHFGITTFAPKMDHRFGITMAAASSSRARSAPTPPSLNRSSRRAPITPLNTAGQGRARPGSVLSAARRIGDATAARNGRASVAPAIVVPDASAAAAAERHQRALARLIDPLLEAGGGGGEDGDMAPETTAFNNLALSAQLPQHPPLSMLLRDEDTGAALKSLPRFGGARGAHRALPAYKALAREKLRVASAAQQRAMGAHRMHNMLRTYASCFSSLLFSAYRTGIVSDALMVAGDHASIYKLLVNVFSLPAIRHHCRSIEAAAELRAVKASSLHVHYTHASMLSNLADSASTTLMGADAAAASAAGVRELLAAKARLQRRDSRIAARQSNTLAAAVAACGTVPSPAALEALRCHAEAVVISFGAQVADLPAPFGASVGEATEAVLAVALALGIKRGLRLGDLQSLTFAALEPAVCARGTARRRRARAQHFLLSFNSAAGKVSSGSGSGFDDGAAGTTAKRSARDRAAASSGSAAAGPPGVGVTHISSDHLKCTIEPQ